MTWFKTAVAMILLLPALAQAEIKIAVLDVEGAILNSKQLQDARQQMESQFSDRRQQLEQLAEEGNQLKAKVEKEGDFLSADERKQLLLEIQSKFKQFQQMKQQLNQQVQQQEQQFLQQMRPQVLEILQTLVEKNDIDMIFNKRALVYGNPAMDLTAEVLEELNKQ